MATEFFSWKESTAQHSEFVAEHGTRTSLGIRSTGQLATTSPWNYEINVNSWYGTASYRGQTVNLVGPQSSQTFNSSTDYEGGRVQLDLIHPVMERAGSGQVVLEGVLSLGTDNWLRTIHGGRLANNTNVSGYSELYQDVYAKTGIKLHGYLFGQPHQLQLGVRLPIYTEETVYLDSLNTAVSLRPEGNRGIYLNWELSPYEPGSRIPSVAFFMEYTEYSASPVQSFSFSNASGVYQSKLYQPSSTAQVSGINLLWSF